MNISRRTVAKYREEMDIKSSSKRKRFWENIQLAQNILECLQFVNKNTQILIWKKLVFNL
jgi:hypothetical protein